jgi:hypothetical protein
MDENRPRVRVDKDREVYWSVGAGAIVMITEVPVLLGKTPQFRRCAPNFPGSKRPRPIVARCASTRLHVEALTATAFALRFRVLELKRLVKALFDEIHQGAVD